MTELPQPVAKKTRTNTPWTPAEEQRLKVMRDEGKSWSEIAKVRFTLRRRKCEPLLTEIGAKAFPLRTEGSVKKHWYKVRLMQKRNIPTLVAWLTETP
jgi:hypothetical protein